MSGGTLNVSGGSINNESGYAVYSSKSASTICITGGTITGKLYILGNTSITGGRFSADPSKYVSTGYQAEQEDSLYVVKPISYEDDLETYMEDQAAALVAYADSKGVSDLIDSALSGYLDQIFEAGDQDAVDSTVASAKAYIDDAARMRKGSSSESDKISQSITLDTPIVYTSDTTIWLADGVTITGNLLIGGGTLTINGGTIKGDITGAGTLAGSFSGEGNVEAVIGESTVKEPQDGGRYTVRQKTDADSFDEYKSELLAAFNEEFVSEDPQLVAAARTKITGKEYVYEKSLEDQKAELDAVVTKLRTDLADAKLKNIELQLTDYARTKLEINEASGEQIPSSVQTVIDDQTIIVNASNDQQTALETAKTKIDEAIASYRAELLNQARTEAIAQIEAYAAGKEPADTMSNLVAVHTVQIYAASDSNEIDAIITAAKAAIDEAFRYKITTYLDGETEKTDYYKPGERVSVTAEVIEGSTFSYWADAEGKLVSVSKTYTFSAAANRTLKAIYNETVTQKSSVTSLGTSAEVLNGRHYVVFKFQRLITSGTVVRYGVLYGTNQNDISNSLALNEDGTIKQTSNVRSQETVSDSRTGTATVKVSVGTGSNDNNLVYACGYVVVQTTDGQYELIKSEIVSTSYNAASGSSN